MNGHSFTERVRKVLQFARDEAAGLHNECVEPEHILLGILREGEGVAAATLLNLGVSLDGLRTETYRKVRTGSHGRLSAEVPYSPQAKHVFELASSTARELN